MSKTDAHDYAGPRRHGSTIEQTHLARVLASIDASDTGRAAAGSSETTSELPDSRIAHPGGRPPDDEFATHYQLAMEGAPASARRVAELYEYCDRIDQAKLWWHRAAELGDQDAVLYVESTLLG